MRVFSNRNILFDIGWRSYSEKNLISPVRRTCGIVSPPPVTQYAMPEARHCRAVIRWLLIYCYTSEAKLSQAMPRQSLAGQGRRAKLTELRVMAPQRHGLSCSEPSDCRLARSGWRHSICSVTRMQGESDSSADPPIGSSTASSSRHYLSYPRYSI